MIEILDSWKYNFDLEEVGAAIFTAWEFVFASYF
jgi:hypothetical protein